MTIDKLRNDAELGRILYNSNLITREEAKEMIEPYLKAVNSKSIELSKKYGRKALRINFSSYCR